MIERNIQNGYVSVRLRFRVLSGEERNGVLHYLIVADRRTHSFSSGHLLSAEEWDTERQTIRPTPQNQQTRRRIRWEMRLLHSIALTMIEENGDIDYRTLGPDFREHVGKQRFAQFAEGQIEKMLSQGRWRCGETYRSALTSFTRFLHGEDVMFYELTPELLTAYQEYLDARGVTKNTISFYMRQLRALYNRAVKLHITPQTHPFAEVYTGQTETAKRAISREAISKIKRVDLSGNQTLAFVRDIFMLSFYLRGISFVDMVFLKKTDLANGYLSYCRHKTGQRLTIKWEPAMQAIVDRYPTDGKYLLPLIRKCGIPEHRQYRNASKLVNRNLKKIATIAGITSTLTMYVSRHSWASIAKQMNIPVSLISEGLGHDSEHTTRIYLATLDTTPLDCANSTIISNL